MEPQGLDTPIATPGPAPELEPPLEHAGLERGQLIAIYGLVIGAAVAIALYRATRRRAGELGVAPHLAGAPSTEGLDARLRGLLEHYANAQQESLSAAANALDRLEGRVGSLEGKVAALTAGKPTPRGAEPAPAPPAAAPSFNAGDVREGIDAGAELAAVPELDDAAVGAE